MTFKYALGEDDSASHPGHETHMNGLKPHTLCGQENREVPLKKNKTISLIWKHNTYGYKLMSLIMRNQKNKEDLRQDPPSNYIPQVPALVS